VQLNELGWRYGKGRVRNSCLGLRLSRWRVLRGFASP
jgi:hypothetical protein